MHLGRISIRLEIFIKILFEMCIFSGLIASFLWEKLQIFGNLRISSSAWLWEHWHYAATSTSSDPERNWDGVRITERPFALIPRFFFPVLDAANMPPPKKQVLRPSWSRGQERCPMHTALSSGLAAWWGPRYFQGHVRRSNTLVTSLDSRQVITDICRLRDTIRTQRGQPAGSKAPQTRGAWITCLFLLFFWQWRTSNRGKSSVSWYDIFLPPQFAGEFSRGDVKAEADDDSLPIDIYSFLLIKGIFWKYQMGEPVCVGVNGWRGGMEWWAEIQFNPHVFILFYFLVSTCSRPQRARWSQTF